MDYTLQTKRSGLTPSSSLIMPVDNIKSEETWYNARPSSELVNAKDYTGRFGFDPCETQET